jgi:hypothetical protein
MKEEHFNYIISEKSGWPPAVRPRPPFSPSNIEVMRSCLLRSLFDASPGYERRMGYAARVGTAFHRALQSFYEDGLPGTKEAAVIEARARFERELRIQQNEANARPREKYQYRDHFRVDRAREAILFEAIRLVEVGYFPIVHHRSNYVSNGGNQEIPISAGASLSTIEVEIDVQSADGLFHGRIDRVEHQHDGDILYDFKSALRDDPDERYERQLQLYALMWHDTRGRWPISAYVVYPLVGRTHIVSIEPGHCQTVVEESIKVVQRLSEDEPVSALANPGKVCSVCEYRPWCKPFWNWQTSETSHQRALERAIYGFSGKLSRVELRDHRWHLLISWRKAFVRLTVPEERLPHLHNAQTGQELFVLDARLKGSPYQPVAIFNENSELFLLQS